MRKLLLGLLACAPVFAQVVFNNTNTMTRSAGASLSASKTVNAGSNLAAFACVAWDQAAGKAITAITYGGQTMTAAGPAAYNASSFTYAQIFYLVNPPTGSNTLAITATTGTNEIYGNIVSFSGVNQTTPVRSATYQNATGSGANPSMTITSNAGTANNPADLTMTCVIPGHSASGTTQTQDGSSTAGGWSAYHDHATTPAATVTHTWTVGAGNWAMAGFSIMSQPPAPTLSLSGCPATGAYGTASTACTINTNQAFDGVGTVTITDSNQLYPGAFTPSVGSPGIGSVTVTPANGTTSFTLTYTPAIAGTRALATTNTFVSGAMNWTNATWNYAATSPQPCTFTMTGSGTQSIAATSGWTSTGSCGHSAPTIGDSLIATASGGSLTITVPNDGVTHMLGTCPSANTIYDLQLTAASAGSAVLDVQPGATFYFCGNKKLTSVTTAAGSSPSVWADLKYETGATVYEDEAQAPYAHRTITAATGEWSRLLWGTSTDVCAFGPGAAYSCPTNVQTVNAGSVYPVAYDPNGTTDSHIFKIYGTAVKGGCGSATSGCLGYNTSGNAAYNAYADSGAITLGGNVFDTTGTVQAAINGFGATTRLTLAGNHFVNDLAGFASKNGMNNNSDVLASCTVTGNYFSLDYSNANLYESPCRFAGNVFAHGLPISYSGSHTLGALYQNMILIDNAVGPPYTDRTYSVPVLDNYVITSTNASSNHFFSTGTLNDFYQGNLFEAPVPGSETEAHCSTNTTAGSTVLTMLDNLSLPSATGSNSCELYGWGLAGNPTQAAGWFDHNGAYGAGQFNWFIFLGHPVAEYPANQTVRSLRANLGWAMNGGIGQNFAVGNHGATLSAAPATNVYVPNEDYNAWYNPSPSSSYGAGVDANCSPSTSLGTPYNQCTASGTPGPHDITGNPKLIDATRGLFKWAAVKHGQASSLAGAEAALLGCQNLQACIAELEAWVRQGYQPTNLALKGAAYDGGVVGVSGTSGSGYSGACSATVTVQDSDDLGTGATLSCSFVGGIPVVTVANPGMHYRMATPATVTIMGTGGSGAALNVVVSPSDIGPVPITLFAGVAP